METNRKEFKSFDKVLIKAVYSENKAWRVDLYSHYDEEYEHHRTFKGDLAADENILPYEGNEYLVGKEDEPDEEVKLETGEYLLAVQGYPNSAHTNIMSPDSYTVIRLESLVESNLRGLSFQDSNGRLWNFIVKFPDFNPNDMEETKKHILCVKNGKVVKYKG